MRRRGHSPADAEDLTQSYFARFFEKGYVRDFRPEAGRFRTFLRASVSHFLANEWDRSRAQKRGGGTARDLARRGDGGGAPEARAGGPHDAGEGLRAPVGRGRARALPRAAAAGGGGRGKAATASIGFKTHLCGDGDASDYATLARELSIAEPAVRVAVHRLRQRFCAVLREEVAETLTDAAEVDSEIRWLLTAVRGDA